MAFPPAKAYLAFKPRITPFPCYHSAELVHSSPMKVHFHEQASNAALRLNPCK